MAVLLALLSAATYGVGDFCGGMAARRVAATTVLLWSHLLGLGLLLVASAVVVGGSRRRAATSLIGALGRPVRRGRRRVPLQGPVRSGR